MFLNRSLMLSTYKLRERESIEAGEKFPFASPGDSNPPPFLLLLQSRLLNTVMLSG